MIDLSVFALQHVVNVITKGLLNTPLLFLIFISLFELISCNDDGHHAHGLELSAVTEKEDISLFYSHIFSDRNLHIDRVRLNPLRILYPYPCGLNPLLKSKPPTKRSVNCRKFSENIF